MKKQNLLTIGFSVLMGIAALPALSQVSNDNEDEVYKIDEQMARANQFVPGQALVKFKNSSPVAVKKIQGKFQSASRSTVDEVLLEFGVADMEKLLPNENPNRTLRKAKAFDGHMVAERDLSQLYMVKMKDLRPDSTEMLVKKLKELDEVEFAEPNYKMYLMMADEEGPTSTILCENAGNNPFYSLNQWNIRSVGLNQLWTKPVVNSERPVIAILDTGVDINHPDLVDNIWTNAAESEGEKGYDNDNNGFKNDVHGWDFINNTADIHDWNMHGTHVAGIAAASNNEIGIVGANPMAYIMPVTVMQSDGTGDVATIIKGINYAAANGATVINMSLGTYANSNALRMALGNAYGQCVIVAAAGNDGLGIYPECGKNTFCPLFPAAYSFVLGVQATQVSVNFEGNYRSSFSNFDCDGPTFSQGYDIYGDEGVNYELSAPGTGILSTVQNGNYKTLSGTSMSAPLVAGGISALQMVKEYNSQEILWGDLIHATNRHGEVDFNAAYNITERPAELELISINYDDNQDGGNGDKAFDAGETMCLYPVIKTTWGEAQNIKLNIRVADNDDASLVDVLNDADVDFGFNLPAYSKETSNNPLKIKIATGVADARNIRLLLTATCNNVNQEIAYEFPIVVNNKVKIHGSTNGNMTLTADHVYYVDDNIAIQENDTLTIEPGTRLEFAEGMGISTVGKLIANGKPGRPIVFTSRTGEGYWSGIESHWSSGIHKNMGLYTNADSTLFTIVQTEQTPLHFEKFSKEVYFTDDNKPDKSFNLNDYIKFDINYEDLSVKDNRLADPNYLTPAILRAITDWKEYISFFSLEPFEGCVEESSYSINLDFGLWETYERPRDIISYCRLEDFFPSKDLYPPVMRDCDISISMELATGTPMSITGLRNVIHDLIIDNYLIIGSDQNKYANVVNNYFGQTSGFRTPAYRNIYKINYFNNYAIYVGATKYNGKKYYLGERCSSPSIDHADYPSYLGTSKEEVIRPFLYELGNAPNTFCSIDLSNMPTRPYAEAHGVVWKVVVNGYDAQDEYEQLPPLGVGKHKFEVYFNRPMNIAVNPNISFGVREPYTQHIVAEDGSWSADSLVYTAYYTINGKTRSDGVNRIYVYGAEDNEYFECPYEKTRFNINIQAAGSMATGFTGEAGLGKVTLTWNNENNDIEDAMGYNLYRYSYVEKDSLDQYGNNTGVKIIVADTVRVNESIIDVVDTEYIDYSITPGETYYYFYRTLSTGLTEYDMSNTVAVTPLTSSKGDANGSGDVDVADVITVVNYAAGQEPKPFIYEAADMNEDASIDILDVIGIIKTIVTPSAPETASLESTATYSLENGIVYVDCPVELAGVQVQLAMDEKKDIAVMDDLKGFEQTSAWLSDNDYIFLGYNLNGKTLSSGKHAILNIGDGQIIKFVLSDRQGHNIQAIPGSANGIGRLFTDVLNVKGIYSMNGQKITGDTSKLDKLPKGVYIVNGQKVVK